MTPVRWPLVELSDHATGVRAHGLVGFIEAIASGWRASSRISGYERTGRWR